MTSDGQPAEQEDDGASTVEEESGEGVGTLDEARRLIRELRERHRAQARQLLTWKRRVKSQEELVSQVARERDGQLRSVSSQLLLLEARLCRKQREIGVLLAERDAVIVRQQRTIKRLQSRLCEAGVECAEEANADSLNDSDSAVIMEDDDVVMRQGVGDGGGVARSVSDAKWAARRNNGLLRRPDVLETVYSVEEDADADADQPPVDSGVEEPGWHAHRGRLKELYGSFERLDRDDDADAEPPPPPPPNHVTTYNRVMSNHRSVTKPKDVKYKRINKAKSKSLEELRGRLKNWVDKGNKIAISLDQSCN